MDYGNKKFSIVDGFLNSQITGKPRKSIHQYPKEYINKLDENTYGFANVVYEISGTYLDLIDGKKYVPTLPPRFSEQHSSELDIDMFVYMKGHEPLVKLLMVPFERNPDSVAVMSEKETILQANMKVALVILKGLCYLCPDALDCLVEDDEFMATVFSCLKSRSLCSDGLNLLEESLSLRKNVFCLSLVKDFPQIMSSLSMLELAYMCRILENLVFDPRIHVNNISLKNAIQQESSSDSSSLNCKTKKIDGKNAASEDEEKIKREKNIAVIEKNHKILLGITQLEKKFIDLLALPLSVPAHQLDPCREIEDIVLTPDFMAILMNLSELNNWIEPDFENPHAYDDKLSSGESSFSFLVLFLKHFSYNVLYILTNLLCGKRRVQFQVKLREAGLVKILEMMFDSFSWEDSLSMECSLEERNTDPEIGVKIRLLRLVANFFERPKDLSHKFCLFSKPELNLIQKAAPTAYSAQSSFHDYQCHFDWHDINEIYSSSTTTTTTTTNGNDKENMGLLAKITSNLIKRSAETSECLFRFVENVCVESFLHGSSLEIQLFVARTGFLKYLVDEISCFEKVWSRCLHQNFDILGYLITWNRKIFFILNDLLTRDILRKFTYQLLSNLVDSNILVRCILVSLERFWLEDQQQHQLELELEQKENQEKVKNHYQPYCFETCKLAQLLAVNSPSILYGLLTSVSIENISQDNISCINTALVFFSYANRRGNVSFYLSKLKEINSKQQYPNPYFLVNLRKILCVWHDYYSHGNTDKFALECSSKMKFSELLEIYEIVLNHVNIELN